MPLAGRSPTTATTLDVAPRPRDWYERRCAMERSNLHHSPEGPRRRSLSKADIAGPVLNALLRLSGMQGYALSSVLAIETRRLTFSSPHLPPAFDGYRILHLTDLHLDIHPELARRTGELLDGMEADLLLLTGDYRDRKSDPIEPGIDALNRALTGLRIRDARIAILGNHDAADSAALLEAAGLTVLANQHASLAIGDERLHLTGLDDVHYFFSDAATAALRDAPEGFRIAAVHSPELADFAAAAGYHLYLCGHTHGGQVCLPGGRPILTGVIRCAEYAKGLWQCEEMQGYTSNGLGCSGAAFRLYCPPEATLIELRRG